MIDQWDMDQSKPCPYDEPTIGTTMAEVINEVMKEELEQAKRGDIQVHEISRGTFLHVGFELEDLQ